VKTVPVRNPVGRFQAQVVEYFGEARSIDLQVFEDDSKSILSRNDSPDLGFRYSLNPYRGCLHACAYCYARPSHEQLGFVSGTDFDRKIVVKPRAPALLRQAFDHRSWSGELILFSGNTDCYQPLEASYQLTRACLEVCLEYGNPVHVITKSPLIERDLELLVALDRRARATVSVSIPFWDAKIARSLEPYVATPARRVGIIRRLAAAGLEVTVNVAPLIGGLGDRDLPKVLEAAADAGARGAALIFLRLPGNVRPVFEERLREALPLAAERVLARTREVRGGHWNDPRFGSRFSGEGEYAAAVRRLFDATTARLGLNQQRAHPRAPRAPFARPPRPGQQLDLFAPDGGAARDGAARTSGAAHVRRR